MSPRKSFVEFCGYMIYRIRNFLVNAEKLSETIKRPKETEVSYQLPPTNKLSNKKKLDMLIHSMEVIEKRVNISSSQTYDILHIMNDVVLHVRAITEKTEKIESQLYHIQKYMDENESKQLNALVEQLKQSTDALSSTVNNERKNENA